MKITLWKNGFQVDDGEFRANDNPANEPFLKDLMNGFVPRELQEKYGRELDVGLEDKRAEEYVPPPPPKYTAYQGEGMKIGGSMGQGLEVNKETGKPEVDSSKPSTKLQIRFHNGDR